MNIGSFPPVESLPPYETIPQRIETNDQRISQISKAIELLQTNQTSKAIELLKTLRVQLLGENHWLSQEVNWSVDEILTKSTDNPNYIIEVRPPPQRNPVLDAISGKNVFC